MTVAIILPARLASTRLPNKLLLEAGGKTILEHSIARAQLAQKQHPQLITKIRVACDDEKLIAAAQRAGADAVMTRPDHQSGTDRIAEAAQNLKEEIVVNLQADEPEIEPQQIYQLASALTDPGAKSYQMATLGSWILDERKMSNPNVVKIVCSGGVRGGRAIYFSRAPIPYPRDGANTEHETVKLPNGKSAIAYGLHHIGVYAYRRNFLLNYGKLPASSLEKIERLEQLRALQNGHDIGVIPVPSHLTGIDTVEDYEAFVKRVGK